MGSHSKGRFKACTEDRISGLPNEILCHILSFLETDVAVKTSFLSHRWKNVWTKVPTITLWDFDYRNSFYRDRFGEFVDHVLLSRGSSDIHTFQLHCSEFEDDSRFDAWICPAVERNVVELEFSVLCYLCEESGMDWEDWLYEFPRSLYMCKTLAVLKLRLLSVITITPNLDCFPSLKVLHLTICHTDTDSMDCLLNFSKLKIVHFQLNFLGLSYAKDPNLMRQYHLPTFSNLINLELFLHRRCSWRLLTKLLKKSPHLKLLVFQISRTVVAYYGKDFVLHVPHVWCPPMWVPICLSSCLKTICIRGFKGRPDEMEAAKYLLKHGEVLNNLIIYTRDFPVEHMMEFRQEISMFPRALKTCQIEFPK